MAALSASTLGPILAAAVALVVVHGLGRFVYTPLLPLLVADAQLTLAEAASLATWNYVGYLAGALLALGFWRRGLGQRAMLVALLANAVITLLQALASDFVVLALLRGANGLSNGLVFVLAPALVLEWLVARGKAHRSGLVYLGVGVGLLGSAALVDLTDDGLRGADRWWPVALASLPLAAWSALTLSRMTVPAASTRSALSTPLWDRRTTPLFLAYAGAGLGYILPMTFLPAVAAEWAMERSTGVWTVVALASLPSTWFWNHLGARIGDRQALLWNYAAQILGLAALLIGSGQALGLWLCAALVGGSFLGAVLLTQRLARTLQPHQGPRLSAALIALYGLAQLLGPGLSRFGIERGASLSDTFVWGLVALIWAFVMMLGVKNDRPLSCRVAGAREPGP